MHTRDASGRKVSLLNDEPLFQKQYLRYIDPALQSAPHNTASRRISPVYHSALVRSASSSPNTPELLRSDSYDSQTSNEPTSPLTPSLAYADYGHAAVYQSEMRLPYGDYMNPGDPMEGVKRPGDFGDSRSASYDDDETVSPGAGHGSAGPGAGAAPTERTGKRYPCRYRDSHGCEKTFTTSGHASRHSKIHTAEKAVQCTFANCAKKFTRADNMKQHLETHFKDRSRSGSRPSAGSRRYSASSKSSKSSAARSTPPLPSPSITGGAWDLRGVQKPPLLTRPNATRTQSSGLDTLAMAAAVQEEA